MLQQLALLAAFALIGGLLDLPFTLYQTFVHRGALRLQQDDAAGCGWPTCSKSTLVGARHRPADRRADPVADGRAPAPVWWLWAWARLDGLQPAAAGDLPDLHRAAVQQIQAAGRRDPQGPRHGADAALRLCRQGPVRDGRQQTQRACQRLLHRLRRRQARGVLRHAAGQAARPARSTRCWRTSWATSSTSTSSSASWRMFA